MESLWTRTNTVSINTRPLSGEVRADVAVIGGGFTGLSAALHLAERGVDVRVLEAVTVGYGGSGRNAGLVNAGLWTPPDEIENLLGRESGARLNSALAGAPDLVFELIEKYGIECEMRRAGTLHCAHGTGGLADLRSRFEQQQRRGAPVTLLGAEETQKRTGTDAYPSALHDARAGTIQPLSYAFGLACAAISAGATVHERSPVLECFHDGDDWCLKTPEGHLRARSLIRATNAYEIDATRPPNHVPVHFLQCATEPIPDAIRDTILPSDEGCWDTATVITSFRTDANGRLILGGIGNLEGAGKRIHLSWARRKLTRLFPALSNIRFSHCWGGRIAMTPTHLPRVVHLGPRGIEIFGYSGRGIAPGTLFGKCAADWITSNSSTAFPIEITPPSGTRLSTARAAFYELGASLIHAGACRLGQ